jgi:Protein of unknown function (DUF3048) N-terminal domain/Protein of unknown function (DUF3048) C-terminal domain
MRFRLTATLLVVVSGGLLASCSSDETASPATTSTTEKVVTTAPPTVATTPPTTEAPTTTTTTPATTTTVPAPVVFPLTGVPVGEGNELAILRTAVIAKVGNYDAHPQWGTNLADIVYEEIINANVSRFAMVFQSQGADRVGPIRSGRRQDVDLFTGYSSPVFAWSGGNGTVTNEVNNSDLINLSESFCRGACFRTKDDSPREFTLFFNINKVWEVTAGQGGLPPQQFQYRPEAAPIAGEVSTGVKLTMDNYDVDWTWNAFTGLYERAQNGRPDNDKSGELVTTNNVVVLSMVYLPGISGSPDAQSTGEGEAWVFSGGNKVHGAWTRADRWQPFTLTADDGTVMMLSPGRTFVELPRASDGNVAPK